MVGPTATPTAAFFSSAPCRETSHYSPRSLLHLSFISNIWLKSPAPNGITDFCHVVPERFQFARNPFSNHAPSLFASVVGRIDESNDPTLHQEDQSKNPPVSPWFRFLQKHKKDGGVGSDESTASTKTSEKEKPIRIGIVGGGIASVSVATALLKRLEKKSVHRPYQIVIWEADSNATHAQPEEGHQPPHWVAATARNANSLVPAAAMHVFSRKSVLWQVVSDTMRAMYLEWKLNYKGRKPQATPLNIVPESPTLARKASQPELFLEPPMYFAAHLIRCMGPSASHDERMSFVRFVSLYLYYTLWLGDAKADERGRILVHLAQANRVMYLKEVQEKNSSQILGHSQGFISLHRTLARAESAMEEAKHHGEEARVMEWDEAVSAEPTLDQIPIRPLYAVHRPNDYTSSCLQFIRHRIQDLQNNTKYSVDYRIAKIQDVKNIGTREKPCFTVKTTIVGNNKEFSEEHKVDYLILAAGTETPLFAARLGAGKACPTYPLRGYSLTIFTPWQEPAPGGELPKNLLRQPFSLDSMYCSSVTPWMARFAGFGEFAGYRDKAINVPSVAPLIMERYASEIFPNATRLGPASACFRPISPDDLPIAGEVPGKPGLFVHSGHGTLGWTMGLVTGDCLAQILEEHIEHGAQAHNPNFLLADGTTLPRKTLSPERFY